MRKLTIFLLSIMLVLVLVGCGSSTPAQNDANASAVQDPQQVTPSESEQKKAELEQNADFVKYNTKGTFTEVGGWYTCKMSASGDSSDVFDAHFMPISYEIRSEFNDIQAKDGYEWKVLEYLIVEDIDENNDGKGRNFSYCNEDYYNSALHDETVENDGDYKNFTIKYGDQEYTATEYNGVVEDRWSEFVFMTKQYLSTYAVMVPKGYDGSVFGIYNPSMEWPDDKYFCEIATDDAVLFRMGNDNIGSCRKTPTFIEVDGKEIYTGTVHDGNIDHVDVATATGNVDYVSGSVIFNTPSKTDLGLSWFADGDFKTISGDSEKIAFNDYGNGILAVQTRIIHKNTPGSSMSSIWQNQGVIFDFNRNICYCSHLYTDADFTNLNGKTYPIIYEADGSIKLSKNIHCLMNQINVD